MNTENDTKIQKQLDRSDVLLGLHDIIDIVEGSVPENTELFLRDAERTVVRLNFRRVPDDVWVNIHESPARFTEIMGIRDDISVPLCRFLRYCEEYEEKVQNCVGLYVNRSVANRFIVLEVGEHLLPDWGGKYLFFG